MEADKSDIQALIREKYEGDADADISQDVMRLAAGEPLAYVIGHIPFLGLTITLDSHPLIPRPETEWWTEKLVAHLNERGVSTVLDLCAGSGAIGLATLKHVPGVHVSFGEVAREHSALIQKNLESNNLDASRADIRTGDLFAPFTGERFDVIATNPPYIPQGRELPVSVSAFEPAEALYGGEDGLHLIRQIAQEAREHLHPGGELWMECDTEHIEEVQKLLLEGGAISAAIQNDQYERPRLVLALY